jgi:pyroglutamyl-peptidase
MGTVILTGFQPFGEHLVNPSQQVAEQLDGHKIGRLEIKSYTLPVVYGEDIRILFPAVLDLRPKLVLCLGLEAGSPCLRVERLAVNLRMDQGSRVEPIVPGGPAAYFASLDVDFVIQAIASRGIPCQPHIYAGDYLCNHVMYQALHFCATRHLPTKVGFIHLPLSMQQAVLEGCMDFPTLPLETMRMGIRTAIESSLKAGTSKIQQKRSA